MDGIYSPSEDSLFLLGIVEGMHESRVAEVGVGSGFVIREYVKVNSPDMAVGTDIDIEALKRARSRSGPEVIEYVLCRSCDGFRQDSFLLIFFNPPYLKTEGPIDLATSGGREGFEITHEMVSSSYRALAGEGSIVFLASSLSSPESLQRRLWEEGVDAVRLASLRLFFEELYAYRVTKGRVSQRFR